MYEISWIWLSANGLNDETNLLLYMIALGVNQPTTRQQARSESRYQGAEWREKLETRGFTCTFAVHGSDPVF